MTYLGFRQNVAKFLSYSKTYFAGLLLVTGQPPLASSDMPHCCQVTGNANGPKSSDKAKIWDIFTWGRFHDRVSGRTTRLLTLRSTPYHHLMATPPISSSAKQCKLMLDLEVCLFRRGDFLPWKK